MKIYMYTEKQNMHCQHTDVDVMTSLKILFMLIILFISHIIDYHVRIIGFFFIKINSMEVRQELL